ncbi:hypothetical protein BDN70DRAFT_936398 [Pholiota conissans]|uniref:Uncharacterized protein n=1 Tax=Pholiota conissans TaxID=109636 RepID=A0A9P5YU61_9AGAR|nr:hypothetical protein BDN70DRAFT_936398 [Pholiota conissans]
MPDAPDYHNYVIRRYTSPLVPSEWGLGIFSGHTRCYTVLDFNDGTTTGVYGSDPENPPVLLMGGDHPSVLFRGLEDSNQLVERMLEKDFLVSCSDGGKYFVVEGQKYYWKPRCDKGGHVRYMLVTPSRRADILADLQVNIQSYQNSNDPMRLSVLNPDTYEMQSSRLFYAILASIVIMCKKRDPWIASAGLCI